MWSYHYDQFLHGCRFSVICLKFRFFVTNNTIHVLMLNYKETGFKITVLGFSKFSTYTHVYVSMFNEG